MQKDPALNRHYKEVERYFKEIEKQLPFEADPAKYEFNKQILIEIRRLSKRQRNFEILFDGYVRKGKKLVMKPLPEEIEEGDGKQ